MAQGTFATVINCIDGRAKHPVTNWVKQNLHVHYVDQITEPGPDRVMTQGTPEQIEAIKQKVLVSLTAHHSQIIIIAAHYDCAGNPVSEDEHKRQVWQSTEILASWGHNVRVIGLWVNSQWQIEVVADNGTQGYVEITYAAAITCVDGRARQPLTDWIQQNHHVHYVDLISVPEPDVTLIEGAPEAIEIVRQQIDYVVRTHHPAMLALAGHFDCAGNTISAEDHRMRIRRAVELVKAWRFPVRILGLWLNDQWQVEVVVDTAENTPTVKLPGAPPN